jgi:hypothetical protein
VALVCPYCNSVIAPTATGAMPATCPRCDARLSAEPVRTVGNGMAPTAPATARNTKTLLAVLGMMALIAVGTALYIWFSQGVRRGHDFKPGFPDQTPAPPTAAPPAERSLIGWLPPRCNILAAVHLADLRKNQLANQAFLGTDGPARIASLGQRLGEVTGLTLNDVEEVVAGIEPTDSFPKVYVLLRTVKPFDAAVVLKRTDRTKQEMVRGRPVGRFSAFNIAEGLVCPIDERMLAIVLRVQSGPLVELESIPNAPRPKLAGTGERLRKIVDELPGQSLAWIAGDLENDSLLATLSAFQANTNGLSSLLETQAFRVSLTADTDFTLQGAFLMPSGKKMLEARPKLEELDWRGPKSLKIETSPADAPPWMYVQARYDVGGIRAVMQSAIGAKEP